MDDDPWAGIDDHGDEETSPQTDHQESEITTDEQAEIEALDSSFSEETHDFWMHPFPIEDHFIEESDVLPLKLTASSHFATFLVADEEHFQHVKMFKDDDDHISRQTHWTISKRDLVGFHHLNAEHLRSFSSLWSTMFSLFIMTAFLTVFSVIEQHLLLLFFFVTGVVPYILMRAQVQWIVLYGHRRKYRHLFWIWNHDGYTFRTSMKHFGTMMHRYLNEGIFYSKQCKTELSYRPKVEKPGKEVEQHIAQPAINQPVAIKPEPHIDGISAQHPADLAVQPTPQSNQPESTTPNQGPPVQDAAVLQTQTPQGENPPIPQPAPIPQPHPSQQPAGPPIGPAQPLPQPPQPLTQQQPVGPPIVTAQPLPQPSVNPPLPNPAAPSPQMPLPPPPNAPTIPTIPPPLPPPPLPPAQAISNEEQQALLDELS